MTCIPAEAYARLRRPPPATRRGDMYCFDQRPVGLGDAVAAVLGAVGITPRLVSRMTGRPCSCRRRRAALNRIVPDLAAGFRPAAR